MILRPSRVEEIISAMQRYGNKNICNMQTKNVFLLNDDISNKISLEERTEFLKNFSEKYVQKKYIVHFINGDRKNIECEFSKENEMVFYPSPQSLEDISKVLVIESGSSEYEKAFEVYKSFYTYYDLYGKIFSLINGYFSLSRDSIANREIHSCPTSDFFIRMIILTMSANIRAFSVKNIYDIVRDREEVLIDRIFEYTDFLETKYKLIVLKQREATARKRRI